MTEIQKKEFNELVANMLDTMPEDIDIRKDVSFMYNAIAACCMELAELYKNNQITFEESFAKTASRNNLIRRCMDRNITPYEATAAVYVVKTNQEMEEGFPFKCDDLLFIIGELVEKEEEYYHYKLVCSETGAAGNLDVGDMKIIPQEPLEGLTIYEVEKVFSLGEEEEETEHLRERYFNSFDVIAMGGNKKEYEELIESMDGILAVKVKPPSLNTTPAGLVTLILLGSEYTVVGDDKLTEIKNLLDPEEGQGTGLIPIGHRVTLHSVEISQLELNIKFEFIEPKKFEDVKTDAENAIKEYLLSLNQNWKTEHITLRKNFLISILISQLKGSIKDIEEIKIFLDGTEITDPYKQIADNSILQLKSITELTS